MQTRIGIVGTGFIGNIHSLAVRNCPKAKLAAVADVHPEKLTKFAAEFGIERVYTDYKELIQEGNVDAVIICTPNDLHAPITLAALKAKLAVMVEKPMAMSPDEGYCMLKAAQKAGAPLMVAHCWRFDREVIWLREQANAGRLGKIVRTKSYGVHAHWGPSGWFTEKRRSGGGALVDMGIHGLDTVRFLIGDPQPVSVYARLGTYYGSYDTDDTGVILVNWEGGAVSYIESGWWQPHTDGPEAGAQLYGTLGFGQVFPTYLEISNPENQELEKVNPGMPPREEHCEQRMYDAQLAYFVDCIQGGRSPSPGGEEGLVNMRILTAAYESAHTGQVVVLTRQVEI